MIDKEDSTKKTLIMSVALSENEIEEIKEVTTINDSQDNNEQQQQQQPTEIQVSNPEETSHNSVLINEEEEVIVINEENTKLGESVSSPLKEENSMIEGNIQALSKENELDTSKSSNSHHSLITASPIDSNSTSSKLSGDIHQNENNSISNETVSEEGDEQSCSYSRNTSKSSQSHEEKKKKKKMISNVHDKPTQSTEDIRNKKKLMTSSKKIPRTSTKKNVVTDSVTKRLAHNKKLGDMTTKKPTIQKLISTKSLVSRLTAPTEASARRTNNQSVIELTHTRMRKSTEPSLKATNTSRNTPTTTKKSSTTGNTHSNRKQLDTKPITNVIHPSSPSNTTMDTKKTVTSSIKRTTHHTTGTRPTKPISTVKSKTTTRKESLPNDAMKLKKPVGIRDKKKLVLREKKHDSPTSTSHQTKKSTIHLVEEDNDTNKKKVMATVPKTTLQVDSNKDMVEENETENKSVHNNNDDDNTTIIPITETNEKNENHIESDIKELEKDHIVMNTKEEEIPIQSDTKEETHDNVITIIEKVEEEKVLIKVENEERDEQHSVTDTEEVVKELEKEQVNIAINKPKMASLRSRFENIQNTDASNKQLQTKDILRSKSPNRISDMINRFTATK
ncbi:uncharacterized protein BX663DRAFT_506801 [Cokeromyces recurvatus]|uniref:uncharacterized protein n=1 Tax=Cokeromyces recurvatus TaxID=90255 RepID=UPI00221F416B|nr:uncharacterized protein BX663DRAFT_506801 [Cokeromyces recurvatus]KAI7903537.1 hypothetical protein BX663DRAFT_506801 [Cokeromyces recurvatus]